jgi:hypothetical protein
MTSTRTSPARVWWRTPLAAVAALLVVYVAASALMDTGGYLGTDTGAKVATLDHMVATGSWHPELPYWAEAQDPTGRVHPIFDTVRVDGRWVHVTTLPMLLAAVPLYALGGYRLALLLPMLGAVGVALAARSLARRMAGEAAGWRAFWVVGLTSPIVVYALDLWEHSLGVACVLGAVALLAGVVEGEAVPRRAIAAGALLGLAATMRTEALVYTAVAVGVCALFSLVAGEVRRAVTTGALAVGGFAPVWLANRGLEVALGGTSREGRATSAASGGLSHVGDRVREAAITLLAARPDALAKVVVVGGIFVGLVAGAVVASRRGRPDVGRGLLVAAAALHLVLILQGLGFVPGMLIAAPLAVVALATRPTTRAGSYALAVAVGSLPLVWAFQYLGGAFPQWAGRYALPSCLLLVTLGVVALPSLERSVQIGIVVLAALVTASGVGWLSERSHAVDRWFEQAAARPEEVLIVRNGFFVREGGAASTERRWLTAVSKADLDVAVGVVDGAGLHTFGTVDEAADAPARLDGARLVGTDATRLLGGTLYIHRYELP